jgi:hypothetical protein
MDLCERGMNVDLEAEKLDLLGSFPKIDLVIATGCIGYIGYKAFANLLKVIKNRQSNYVESEKEYTHPIFALEVFQILKKKQILFQYCTIWELTQKNMKTMAISMPTFILQNLKINFSQQFL